MTNKFFHEQDGIRNQPVVLVAGGAGFVGSFLCELLLQQNCQVVCLDNLNVGNKKNLKNCLNNPNFLFLEQNLDQSFDQKIEKPDYIFHLAGLETYVSGVDVSFEVLLNNVSGTINLLKLAEKTGAKFLLGSTQKVFQAKISAKKLTNYFGKGPTAEISSLAEAKRSAEALTTEYMERNKIDARVVRLDWVYGPRMNLKTGGVLTQLIKQTVNGGPLKIPGDGSQKIRPTFVSDVVYGLSKAIFSLGTSGKIYNLVNPEEEAILTIAHRLQKFIGEELEIEYVAAESFPVFESILKTTGQEKLKWEPRISLDDGLKQTLAFFQKQIKKPKKREVNKKTKKANFFKKRPLSGKKKFILSLIFTILIIIFYLPGVLVLNSFLGVKNLQSAYQNAITGNFEKTIFSGKVATGNFSRAQENLNSLNSLFEFFGQDQFRFKIETYLTIGLQSSRGLSELGRVAYNLSQISRAIFQDQPGDINQLATEIKTDLDSVYQQFSYLEGQLKTKPESHQFLTKFDDQLVEKLTTAREMILWAKEGIQILPDIIGVYGKKTYLVLLQNNMELRPTGGFLGSFALATFEQGKLIDFQVTDVYTADGQLKGHVEPPEPIRRYLGEAGWYLRDSNFSPDFPVSAERASWFLEKELGRKVDGVIGINLFLAQRILRAIGPVNLLDYQEQINADNLFERAEYQSETDFFPGSTQKKDFLGSLASALFEQIQQADEQKWLSIGQAIYQSLKSKDLTVVFNHQEAAKILTDSGWDGGLRKVRCTNVGGECLMDYLMIVESNFGVNKANYFIKRELTHQVSFNQGGKVSENLKIVYHNQSQTEVFPAGKYKNYLRILTPKGTKLNKIVIDNEEIGEDEIDETEINDKSVFGFLFEVPIQSKKTVEISYQLAEKLVVDADSRYLLYLQKQPGIEDKMFNFWLVPPPGARVVSARPEFSSTSGLVIFSPEFVEDLVFEVSF